MARHFGVDQRRADARADDFAEDVSVALNRVARSTARGLSATPSELDLTSVRGAWRTLVADQLLPLVEREWRRAADELWAGVADAVSAADAVHRVVVAAAGVDSRVEQVSPGTFAIPKVSIEAARSYLQTAENRLAGVGDLLWQEMRETLTSGLVAGKGTADVARDLRKTADLTKARADVIARTEMIGATNRGAYSQMLATGLDGTKTWLAANDSRTRPSHAAVDNEAVTMTGTFTVGGYPMDGPHDPGAPAGETINCRCTLTYDVEVEPAVETAPVVTVVEPARAVRPGLTPEQYAVLKPDKKRAESTIRKALGQTTQGENVLAKIKQFTQTRGGVARFRQEVTSRLAGEASDQVTARVDDFLAAMNGYPPADVPQLYRGLGIKPPKDVDLNEWFDEFEASYQVGKRFDLNVTSFTSNDRVANQFMTGTGGGASKRGLVQVKILVDGEVHALPVEQLSKFAYEKEWIAGGEFEVTSFEPPAGKRGHYLIHVRQVRTLTS
jgi:F like protein